MGDFLSKIWDFFSNERISLTPKITIPLFLIIIVFLFVDYYGFFYYYANSEKVEYLSKIEEAKERCSSDTIIVSYLDEMLYDAVNRKNIFQQFAMLFENEDVSHVPEILDKNDNSDSFEIERIFPLCERNQLWHTATASLFWILWLVLLSIMLLYIPFSPGDNRLNLMFGMIIGIGVITLLIWVTQWLFGLIPVILGRAYINYIIQLAVNLVPMVLFAIKSKKK
ncbi:MULTISPECIES: hypothetical protein [Bacteroides]|jgi:lipopolysaccharide export LptBFGC system permease protein LptF|uniref:hypothetical protein n=1 Tax=Bacteroides TaxID=816 RepID=UPI000E472A16|nr:MULTISPECIES: hypothetical protein [Bacteroides]RHL10385.1 hypothetical protein DW036_07715 [Bacteroides sp. AF39-11AC]